MIGTAQKIMLPYAGAEFGPGIKLREYNDPCKTFNLKTRKDKRYYAKNTKELLLRCTGYETTQKELLYWLDCGFILTVEEHRHKTLTPEGVAKAIGIPLKDWIGNCFAVAEAMVKKGVVKGEAVYGHWHGMTDPESVFADRFFFTNHGWIIGDDLTFIDPTRWVFENCDPYIYQREQNEVTAREYDRGGNKVRRMLRNPLPEYDADMKSIELKFEDPEVERWVRARLGNPPTWTRPHLHYLAILTPDEYEGHIKPIYETLVAAGQGVLIPIDNRVMVLGEENDDGAGWM